MFSQKNYALGLLSAGSLLLEISLTKVLSSAYFPPYVFAVITLAIVGIGFGAGLSAWYGSLRSQDRVPLYVSLAGLAGILVVAALPMIVQFALQPVLFGFIIIPFIFIGLAISTIFSTDSAASHTLYMVDLVGAGLGVLLVIPLLDWFGATNSIFVSVCVLGMAVLLFDQRHSMLLGFGLAVLGLLALGGNLNQNWFAVDMGTLDAEKPLTGTLQAGGEILETRHDSFARTDLVDPGDGSPLRIYVDGAAASVMPPAGVERRLISDIGFFPFATAQPERVFIIGPGGGLDVWFALQSGSRVIDAAEVNRASNALVQDYAAYNGNLYGQPQVNIIADEGRSALRRTGERYDLIFLSQIVTLVAERNGYALAENAIFTVEAFREYLDHLTPEGMIAIKLYDEITLTRAVSTAMEAFHQEGLDDVTAMQHLMALADTRNTPALPLLMIRATPFSGDDSAVLGAIAQDVGFTPVLLPGVLVQPPLDAVANGMRPYSDIIEESSSDISATTDNRPFFYQFERGIPQTLHPLLGMTLAVTVIGCFFLLRIVSKTQKQKKLPLFSYFAAIGIGFITAEIVVLQQTRLFLGHPTFATALSLGTLLIGGGLGSGLVPALMQRQQNRIRFIPLWIVVCLLLWSFVWVWVGGQFVAAPMSLRATVTILSLLPLSLLMGMPFPIGMKMIAMQGDRFVALAWAINGLATVIGSVLAVVLSLLFGFNAVIFIGMLAYGLAALFMFLDQPFGSA